LRRSSARHRALSSCRLKGFGPAIQAADARLYLLPRRQHQHRQVGVHGADRFQDMLAVHDRHIQIQNRQIRLILAKCLYGGPTVVGQSNAVSVGLQAAA
jgi:hypothetical protein